MTSIKVCTIAVLPETCYVWEAVSWVALGRVPTSEYDEAGIESREEPDVLLSGDVVEFDSTFSLEDFAYLNLQVDWERYITARFQSFGRSGQEHLAARLLPVWEQMHANDPHPGVAEHIAEIHKEAAEADWVQGVEAAFSPLMDGARASIYQSLSAGRLRAVGWLSSENADVDAEDNGHEREGQFVAIPNTEWSMRLFDWDASTLKTPPGRVYRAVKIFSNELVQAFPTPACAGVKSNATIYPGCVLLDEQPETVNAADYPARRGRRPIADGVVKRGVHKQFGEHIRGITEDDKLEALVEEVCAWVLRIYEQKISRSTAQNYLRPLFADANNSRQQINVPAIAISG